jgi:TPR repeat protein
MKTLATILCLMGAMLLVSAAQSSALPPCPSNPNAHYDNCFGTSTYAYGDKYVGEWKNGKYNGQGAYTYANGNQYVGEYKDNKANGQGTYTYTNGDKYVGEYKSNKAHGQGTLTYGNGNQYVGEFKDDIRNGQGTITYASGGVYDGEWKDGRYNGQGTYVFANGDKYVGEFNDDKANGQGTLTYGNGDKYVGEDKNEERGEQETATSVDRKIEEKTFKSSKLVYEEKAFPTVDIKKFPELSSKNDTQKGLAAESGDFASALRYWKPLAEQGNANAQSNVGWIYQHLQSMPRDYRTAVKWYRLAAEQGYIDAQNYLGAMYEKGNGVPHDEKVAMIWYKLAAEQGSIFAQNSLGWMYGLKEDYKVAVKWYKLAAEKGYALAQYNLGFIYDFKQGNFEAAIKWYKLAAEQGVARAQRRLQELQNKIIDQKIAPIVTAKISPISSSETQKELVRLRKEIILLMNEEKKKSKPQPIAKTGTSGLGYLVSVAGHVITNQHIVNKCQKVTVGVNAENQTITDIIKTDIENDLALLKMSTLKKTSAETKYLIQKRGIKTTPLASGGLLRSVDVDLGEGELATVYPYDSLISGVATQLSKRKRARQGGSIPAKVNLDINAPKVRQFLSASELSIKWLKGFKSMPTKDITKITKRQAMIVICYQ